MRKSSSSSKSGVKVTAKDREQLLDVLKPNIKAIVKQGMEQYVGDGTRLMLELLLHAEARELCGRVYSRSGERKAQRWGTERKATGIVRGVKQQLERPRLRAMRNVKGGGGEVQLETYKVMNRTEL